MRKPRIVSPTRAGVSIPVRGRAAGGRVVATGRVVTGVTVVDVWVVDEVARVVDVLLDVDVEVLVDVDVDEVLVVDDPCELPCRGRASQAIPSLSRSRPSGSSGCRFRWSCAAS
jgi:hypothetical protein